MIFVTRFILSDENFIAKLHFGEESIFKKIFKQFYLPIRSFASRFVKDNDIAEDIVQDVFLQMWEKRLMFATLSEIKSYLYTCVRNACLDHLKHERIKQKHEIYVQTFVSPEEEQEYILEEEVDALIQCHRTSIPTSTKNCNHDNERGFKYRNCPKTKYNREYGQIHETKGLSSFT